MFTEKGNFNISFLFSGVLVNKVDDKQCISWQVN